MYCTGWVNREVIFSDKSGICDKCFEGIVIMHLVSENIVVESGIRV